MTVGSLQEALGLQDTVFCKWHYRCKILSFASGIRVARYCPLQVALGLQDTIICKWH